MLSIVMKAPGATLGFSIPTDLISDPLIGELSRLASCHADSLAELETTAVESPLSSQLDEDLVHDLESLDLGGRPWGVIFQDGHPRGLCRISGAESHGPSIHMHFADDDGTPAPLTRGRRGAPRPVPRQQYSAPSPRRTEPKGPLMNIARNALADKINAALTEPHMPDDSGVRTGMRLVVDELRSPARPLADVADLSQRILGWPG